MANVNTLPFMLWGWTGTAIKQVAVTTDGYVKVDIQDTSLAVTCTQLPATLGQTTGAGSLSVVLASDTVMPKEEYAKAIVPVLHNFASTGITASAYTQLIASTGAKLIRLFLASTAGSFLTLATGAGGAEVPFFILPPGGSAEIEITIASATRISVTSDENVTTGKLAISALV